MKLSLDFWIWDLATWVHLHYSVIVPLKPQTQDMNLKLKFDIVVFTEEEDFTSILRDRSHIDETLRLAAEEKAGDYAGGDPKNWLNMFHDVWW